MWTALVAALLIIAAFTVAAIYLHRAEPILKQRVIETLATRYDSRVELAGFQVSLVRGFEVTGSGLKLYPNSLDMQQPLILVDQFRFRTSWHDLFRTPMHIGLVRVTGLGIHLPPKDQRHDMPRLNQHGSHGKIQILVDQLDIGRASLILGTDKPGKVPLDFEISDLRMTSVGAGQPMRFHALLVNPKPIGDIDSTGSFGPFDAHSPGDTPVSGIYSFKNADLGPLKGIGGTLSSTGKYEGTLNNIVVDGKTDTPNFSLDTSGNPVPLHTTFHAIVDGTNGDTHLEPVDAELRHSHIVARGDVITVPNQGHRITLDVTVQPANIEDILDLATKTQPALMNGALVLHTSFLLPPGKESVTQKLQLKGNFHITDVHFSDPRIQDKVDELSLRSQGHPEKAKQDAKGAINANVASDMKGNFTLGNGKVTITGLRYNVPGANIALSGFYGLDSNQIDFHGTARLDAKVSQMVTGWKSWLLKPVDPFFSKGGAGTQVPIQITGTRSDMHFGLDFGHNGKDKKTPDKNSIP
jgi:AsmA-like C-terminal region